jgi:hypothetical protein
MSQKEAQKEALQRASEELKSIDLKARCRILELPAPEKGHLCLRIFGMHMIFNLTDLTLSIKNSKEPAKLGDHILLLHYLLHDKPIIPSEEDITFRQLPGGQFYWQPFLSRTAKPLVARIGNDLDLLKKNLARFDTKNFPAGDLGAKIHTLGKIYIKLVYHKGDDEFPPAADILFDPCIKQIFPSEDAAVLASRICLGLL